MPSIHSRPIKNTALLICLAAGAIFSASGCSYRLTNLHIQNPGDIQTIAIESVFDTGGQVIPHEQLWDQLQKAFAANGHLKVTSAKTADALLRAHIRMATIDKSGSNSTPVPIQHRDPDIYTGNGVPSVGVLQDLTVASSYFNKDATNFSVDIEIWNLETHKLMLQRSYSGHTDVNAVQDPRILVLVRHDESADRAIATVAKSIAETVVSDLLVK